MKKVEDLKVKEVLKEEYFDLATEFVPFFVAVMQMGIVLMMSYDFFDNHEQGEFGIWLYLSLLLMNTVWNTIALVNAKLFIQLTRRYGDLFDQTEKKVRDNMIRALSFALSVIPFFVLQLIYLIFLVLRTPQVQLSTAQFFVETIIIVGFTLLQVVVFRFLLQITTSPSLKRKLSTETGREEGVSEVTAIETEHDFLYYKYTRDFKLRELEEKLFQLKKIENTLTNSEITKINERVLVVEKVLREYSFIRYRKRHFVRKKIEATLEELNELLEVLLMKNDKKHIERIEQKLEQVKKI
jgi:hypothetical protein